MWQKPGQFAFWIIILTGRKKTPKLTRSADLNVHMYKLFLIRSFSNDKHLVESDKYDLSLLSVSVMTSIRSKAQKITF